MASLVADYTDSDSEEETPIQIKTESEEITIKQEPCENEKSVNFFDSADYDSDEEKKALDKSVIKTESVDKLPNLLVSQKLPSILEASTSRIGTSVFSNPFEEAEQAKNQILEKHVKLTQATPRKPAHQPFCWKFKKGKCHLGKNCRFFHDPESRTLEERTILPTDTDNCNLHQQATYHPSVLLRAHYEEVEKEAEDDDSYLGNMKKRKRYGLADNMMPPKKALESLQRQREKERPWTLTDTQ